MSTKQVILLQDFLLLRGFLRRKTREHFATWIPYFVELYYSDGIQTFWTRCSCFCFVFLPAAITRCYYSLSSVILFLRPNKRKLPNLTVIKNTEQREGTFRICAQYPLNQLKFKDLAGESGHVVVLSERIDRCVLFCLKFSKASYVDKFLIRCSAFHPIQGLF